MTDHHGLLPLLSAWDIDTLRDVTEISAERVYKVEALDGPALLLKRIGADEEAVARRFAFECDVLEHLQARGVPLGLPMATRMGGRSVARDGILYTLSPFLRSENRGLSLDREALRRLNRNCGRAIGLMDEALAAFPSEGLSERTWRTRYPEDLHERWIPSVRAGLSGRDIGGFMALMDEALPEMDAALRGLEGQLIHRDCHHGNVVVEGEDVSGFVDFDHLSLGPRLFDPAYFIAHMIKGGRGSEGWEEEFFDLFPAVLRGYAEARGVRPREALAIPPLMEAMFIMFAGWSCELGRPADALAELESLAWVHRNRLRIVEAALWACG
jgi:Ser/Thr protein kinase RdoA (MazF antagonist)